jgi:hypothetical protein
LNYRPQPRNKALYVVDGAIDTAFELYIIYAAAEAAHKTLLQLHTETSLVQGVVNGPQILACQVKRDIRIQILSISAETELTFFLLFHEHLNPVPVVPWRLMYRFKDVIRVSMIEGRNENATLHVLIAAT